MDKNQKDKEQQAIEALFSKPVGRRWVLKVGASLAMIGGLGSIAACSGGTQDNEPESGEPEVEPTVPRTLQLVLNQDKPYSDLHLVISGQTYPLLSHTSVTRTLLNQKEGVWRKLNSSRLTHQVTVAFPTERARLATVYGSLNGQKLVVAQSFLVPESATSTIAQASFYLTGNYTSVAGSPERLAALGLSGSQITSVDEVIQLEQVMDTYQVAVALTMLHPNVATRAPLESAATKSLLHQTPEVSTLGTYIGQMQQNGKPFAHLVPAVDATGQLSKITIKGKDKTITTGFSSIQLNQTDATFTQTARSAFVAGIQGVRNTGSLGRVDIHFNQIIEAAISTNDLNREASLS